MKEEFLENLRSEYRKTGATLHLRQSGWEDIAKKIEAPTPFYKQIFGSFAKLSIGVFVFLILITTLYGAALASMPGGLLYPVKIFSEKVAKVFTGNNQVAIDHRVDEIVTLSRESEINARELKKVVIEYRMVVEEEQEKVRNSEEQKQEFQERLESHRVRFDEITSENPGVEKEIEEAKKALEFREGEKDED